MKVQLMSAWQFNYGGLNLSSTRNSSNVVKINFKRILGLFNLLPTTNILDDSFQNIEFIYDYQYRITKKLKNGYNKGYVISNLSSDTISYSKFE